jgi:hypothetical protein
MGYLKRSGFVMLSLPQIGVQPLQLLLKTSADTVERLNAPIKDLFVPDTTDEPDIGADTPLAAINGEEEFNMGIKADVGFLQGLASFFNLKGNANISYEQGKRFKIQLDAPLHNTINIVRLAGFIKDAKVNESAGSIITNLKNEEIYIITETIKAKSFRVEDVSNKLFEASLQAEGPGLVKASAETHVAQKSNAAIVYEGTVPMTFALKAHRIRYSGGGFFGGKAKYTIESDKDLEKVLEGEIEGVALETPGFYLNAT